MFLVILPIQMKKHTGLSDNMHRLIYKGVIECGPRYCPSIEDKVVRFMIKIGIRFY